jgi:seipin
MEPPNQNDDVGFFFDALDDFPFHDCIVTAQSAHSTSTSALSDHSPDSPLIGSDALVIDDPGKRRRKNRLKNYLDLKGNWRNLDGAESTRSISDRVGPRRADSSAVGGVGEEEKKEESMVTRANDDRFGDPVDSAGELDESTRRAYSSAVGGVGEEEKKEESTVTTAIDDRVGDSVGSAGELDESTNLLLFVAGLVIKAIGFQLNLLVYFVTFPLWILYCFYMLVVDPFGAIRRGRGFIVRKLVSLWNLVGGFFGSFIDDWLKEHKTIWSLLMQFGWGLFWSCYVCVILCGLLVFSVMLSGVLMRYLVEEPIKIRQDLIFDYTKDNPVAYVPIQSCGGVACCEENIGDFKSLNTRVIPPNHKLQVSVLLTMPESEYNRNLGVFQVHFLFIGQGICSVLVAML